MNNSVLFLLFFIALVNSLKVDHQCQCPNGFTMSSDRKKCSKECPNSPQWKNEGQFCRKIEYSRGQISFGIPGFVYKEKNRNKNVCQRNLGVGNCQRGDNDVYYRKCKQGYQGVREKCKPISVDCAGPGGLLPNDATSCKKISLSC